MPPERPRFWAPLGYALFFMAYLTVVGWAWSWVLQAIGRLFA